MVEARHPPDGRAAWLRLLVSVALVSVGGSGMWTVVVALPAVQAEFGVDRGSASLPYSLLMLGVAIGGILFGRISDKRGIVPVSLVGSLVLSAGFLAAAAAPNLTTFALVHGALIGIGCSASFSPMMADISFWFRRRRGIAVTIVASGNYVAGAIWPPVVQALVAESGWRTAYMVVGVLSLALMLPLALLLRRFGPRPEAAGAIGPAAAMPSARPVGVGLSPGALQGLLVVAGLSCCIAMAMPQVHIVAYCADRGFGTAHGADMLALMLGFGIVSRVGSGVVADRIGPLPTLLVSSALQGAALLMYTLADSLASLYAVSILFGLFQGGIVPMYALIVRQLFPAGEAGLRVGLCISATLVGMAVGGWMSGWIFDLTGSYRAAFTNGLAWNLLNTAVAAFLILRLTGRRAPPSSRPHLAERPA